MRNECARAAPYSSYCARAPSAVSFTMKSLAVPETRPTHWWALAHKSIFALVRVSVLVDLLRQLNTGERRVRADIAVPDRCARSTQTRKSVYYSSQAGDWKGPERPREQHHPSIGNRGLVIGPKQLSSVGESNISAQVVVVVADEAKTQTCSSSNRPSYRQGSSYC